MNLTRMLMIRLYGRLFVLLMVMTLLVSSGAAVGLRYF